MQTVFAEKTEDRSLDDNRHIGELFFIRMYWEKGRIPSGNILYWKDAKREDAQINFTGFDGLLLYLDETCEQNGVLLRKAQVRRNQKRRRYLETGKELELVKKSEHAAVFWLKVMGREFASFQGIVHIWGRDYPYRSGFELIILLKDIVGFTERRSVRKNWKAERNTGRVSSLVDSSREWQLQEPLPLVHHCSLQMSQQETWTPPPDGKLWTFSMNYMSRDTPLCLSPTIRP